MGSTPVHLSLFLFAARQGRLPLINLAFIYTMKFQTSGSFFLLLSLQNKTKLSNMKEEINIQINMKQYKHVSGHKLTNDFIIYLFFLKYTSNLIMLGKEQLCGEMQL